MGQLDLSGSDIEKISKIMNYAKQNLRTEENIQNIHQAILQMRSVYL